MTKLVIQSSVYRLSSIAYHPESYRPESTVWVLAHAIWHRAKLRTKTHYTLARWHLWRLCFIEEFNCASEPIIYLSPARKTFWDKVGLQNVYSYVYTCTSLSTSDISTWDFFIYHTPRNTSLKHEELTHTRIEWRWTVRTIAKDFFLKVRFVRVPVAGKLSHLCKTRQKFNEKRP